MSDQDFLDLEHRLFALELEEASGRLSAPDRAEAIVAMLRRESRVSGWLRVLIAAAAIVAVAALLYWTSGFTDGSREVGPEPQPPPDEQRGPTNTLSGQVRFPNGASAVGVTVVIEHTKSFLAVTALTDSEGRFQVPDVDVGRYRVWAENKDWFPKQPKAVDEVRPLRPRRTAGSRRAIFVDVTEAKPAIVRLEAR